MSTVIFSDQMTQPYSGWLTDSLHTLGEHKVSSIALAATLEDGQVFTGYYACYASDKAMLAHHIYTDSIMDVVKANADDLFDNDE